jgi:hypothetical protein
MARQALCRSEAAFRHAGDRRAFKLLPWQEKIVRDVFGTVRESSRICVSSIRCTSKLARRTGTNSPCTYLPTPEGWTTMGDIRVGDQVFDEQGKSCNVVA